jgi:ABC-type antimicrobial peptide transport system permease subunit
MSVEDLVDLLEEELRLRTTIYQNQNSKKVVIVEITDYYYDYDALYKKYGITPEDNSSESYNNFIKYITTSEETKRLKNQQAMFAQMWGVD